MTTRGGPGRGQGRKPVAEGEQTVTVSLRMTEAQREKLVFKKLVSLVEYWNTIFLQIM